MKILKVILDILLELKNLGDHTKTHNIEDFISFMYENPLLQPSPLANPKR